MTLVSQGRTGYPDASPGAPTAIPR